MTAILVFDYNKSIREQPVAYHATFASLLGAEATEIYCLDNPRLLAAGYQLSLVLAEQAELQRRRRVDVLPNAEALGLLRAGGRVSGGKFPLPKHFDGRILGPALLVDDNKNLRLPDYWHIWSILGGRLMGDYTVEEDGCLTPQ